MTPTVAEQRNNRDARAPRRKILGLQPGMWLVVLLLFAAQIAVMFCLGNPPAAKPFRTAGAPVIYLATNRWDELLALEDPTLFVLPHRNNFSGAAWLTIKQQNFEPTNWAEPARPLPLPPEQLGADFAAFLETNPPPQIPMATGAESAATDLVGTHPTPMRSISVASTLRVEGALVGRRLVTPVELPPQTNSDFDVLPNTEVQVLVDAQGKVFSPVIISASKNTAADAGALNFARNARFEPLKTAALGKVPPNAMTFGRLIFEWQTMPPAPTNAPPSSS